MYICKGKRERVSGRRLDDELEKAISVESRWFEVIMRLPAIGKIMACTEHSLSLFAPLLILCALTCADCDVRLTIL